MPYPGYGSFDSPMWSLPELMANKWFILDGRAEPRDLFDLWFGLTHFHVEWAELVRAHRDRYGFAPLLTNIGRRGLRERWESRLGPQIRDLPPLDEVERELRWHVEFEQELGQGLDAASRQHLATARPTRPLVPRLDSAGLLPDPPAYRGIVDASQDKPQQHSLRRDPLRTSWTLLYRTVRDSIDDRLPGPAAEVSFYLLLSLPPLLLVGLGAIGYVGDLFGPNG